jgi:hypothetical protein
VSATLAPAPITCATIRPANEIQADRTLSFFFFGGDTGPLGTGDGIGTTVVMADASALSKPGTSVC